MYEEETEEFLEALYDDIWDVYELLDDAPDDIRNDELVEAYAKTDEAGRKIAHIIDKIENHDVV